MGVENEIGVPKRPIFPDDDSYMETMDQAENSELSGVMRQKKIKEEIDLLKRLVKMAKAQPEMQFHLVPLMKRAKSRIRQEIGCFRAVSARVPQVTAERWFGLTVPEKHAAMVVRDVAHEDSTMARKLQALIGKPLRRAEGSPRFLEDIDGARMAKELYSIINYVTKQVGYCA